MFDDGWNDWLAPRRGRLRRGSVVAVAVAVSLAGCSAYDIRLVRTDPELARRDRVADALSGDRLSNSTLIVLRRNDLAEKYDQAPREAIAQLHRKLVDGRVDASELAALAELSFQYARSLERELPTKGRREGAREHGAVFDSAAGREARSNYLAATLYASAYAFPQENENEDERVVSPFDGRGRTVTGVYNFAVGRAFSDDMGVVYPRAGTMALPFGTLEVRFDPDDLSWGDRTLTSMLPVSDYVVTGLDNRYRRDGVGAALTARTVPTVQDRGPDFVDPNAWVAATLILDVEDPWGQLRTGEVTGDLSLFKETDGMPVLSVRGRQIPVEFEPSAAVAASLEQSKVWEAGTARFFGRALAIADDDRLFARKPHREGLIPVVLVHGTDSTPATWANTVNDLESDPWIRDRFIFWYFSYESGSPILYSGLLLRQAMAEIHDALDVDDSDSCLDEMVVIGHSQGGLLTKLTAIDSGTKFWDTIFDRPFEEVEDELSPESRKLFREGLFFAPPPFVKRVVFMSTPHGGSYLASSDLLRRLSAKLIRMPVALMGTGADLLRLKEYRVPGVRQDRLSTSIDNMAPSNPMLKTLHEIPVSPGIVAHSIIALRAGEDRETGSDGVVKYKSAHIDGVASELVVTSAHSVQSKPKAVAELDRILRLHAEQNDCWGVDSGN